MVDQEAIANFMAITGCEDTETVNNYLEFGGGDIGTAVQLFMESEGAGGNSNSRSRGAGASTSDQIFAPQEEVRAPIAPKREMLAASSPYHGTFDPHGQDMRGYSQLGEDWGAGSSRATSSRELIFAPPRDLMFSGSFEMAQKVASEKKLWIMITLHDESEFACVEFNRDIWKDKAVKETVKEHFVFFFYENNSAQGQQHLNYYSFTHYPYVAIIDPLTKERVKYWSKKMNPDQFLMEVSEFLISKSELEAPRKKKKTKDVSMLTEDEQLELALQASLRGDSVQDLANEIIIIEDNDDVVEITADPIPDTNDPTTVYNAIPPLTAYSPSTKDTTRLQIKFPTGKRVVQAFDKTASIATVFGFIKGVHADDITGPFDLFKIRDPLLLRQKETLAAADVLSAALTLDYIV